VLNTARRGRSRRPRRCLWDGKTLEVPRQKREQLSTYLRGSASTEQMGDFRSEDTLLGMPRSPDLLPIHITALGHCDQPEQSFELLVGDLSKPINLQISAQRSTELAADMDAYVKVAQGRSPVTGMQHAVPMRLPSGDCSTAANGSSNPRSTCTKRKQARQWRGSAAATT
jgi:hypothetical protein